MELWITGITLSPGEGEVILRQKAAGLLQISPDAIGALQVVRKSLDARRERPPRYVYIFEVSVPDSIVIPEHTTKGITIRKAPKRDECPAVIGPIKPVQRPIIVGCGPAGIFAALTFSFMGIPALILERGKPIAERVKDVEAFWSKGFLNAESNVYFGEGGAGTFSDGKLTSRVRNPYTGWVKQILFEAGAPADILTDARPHIGTDLLRKVVISLRNKLVSMGSEVRFAAKVTDFIIHHEKLLGVVVNDREEIRTEHLILAIGQSAEDTYRKLYARGVSLEGKPFAMGVRVEHPQAWINGIQYGQWWEDTALPPAEYFLTARVPSLERSVYTFCMCPGGQVIGCSAAPGRVITNGMSGCRRDGHYANSAVVVNIRSEDFGGSESDPLAGLEFRRPWEEKAYLLGGKDYVAPAQRLVDFLQDREGEPGPTSFRPGVKGASLRHALPPFVAEALKQGLRQFEKKMRGFIMEEAHLIGVETRTSSPLRILRKNNGESVSIAGLYPCGEGAGYAGGIVSSALDGIRAVEGIIASLRLSER